MDLFWSFLGLILVIGGISALLLWLRIDDFWTSLWDFEPVYKEPESYKAPEPEVPKIRRFLGPHRNPLSLDKEPCEGLFEQRDERTWQCIECELFHFEHSEDKS